MKKKAQFINPLKVITGPDTRWSYANVWDLRLSNQVQHFDKNSQ